MAALFVLVLMAALYAGPVQKELRVGSELQVAHRQVALLQSPAGELDLARSCGYTFPGERAVFVQGQASTCGGGG
jgi:hypothetical protein